MTKLPEGFLQAPIAHRALHDAGRGRVENSRAAIEAAMASGYAIEMDLQLSRDHQAMVFHDYHLDRLTGETGPVLVRDAAELTGIELGDGEDGIPTFAEALELVAGRVPLLIELKDQHGSLGVTNGALEQAVARALRRYTGPCAVMSFNPNMVAELARLVPDVPRGLVTSEFEGSYWAHLPEEVGLRLRDIPDAARVGASFISHHAPDLGRARVQELRAGGMPVFCWTIRSEAQEREARLMSDNITFEGYEAMLPA